MARTRIDEPAPQRFPARTITAAATRLRIDDKKTATREAAKRQDWQDEAWAAFDDVPELKFATWFTGNAMAKLRLAIAVRPLDGTEPVIVVPGEAAEGIDASLLAAAHAELARLKGPYGGQSELQREFNMNFEVAGECYLVGYGATTTTVDGAEVVVPEEWDIKSVSEVEFKSGEYFISDMPGAAQNQKRKLDPATDAIIRLWQRHPRYSKLPDAHIRAVLSDCEALLLLTNEIKAIAKSHQAAGILTVPNELSFGADDPTDGEEDGDTEDTFTEDLMSALIDPIEDSSSASSVMPLVVRGPAEFLKPDALRIISFGRTSGYEIENSLKARVERVARGINLPVEVVMGHQSTTFANAGQVNRDTFDDHLEPRAVAMVDALTMGYLHPNLRETATANQYDPAMVDRVVVWYDETAVVGTPDLTASADKGAELGLISGMAWRRARGWDEDDAPSPEELAMRLASKAAAGNDPAATTAALQTLAQMIAPAPRAVLASGRKKTNVGKKLAAIDRDLRARLGAAASAAVDRALTRAGNRLKSKAGVLKEMTRGVAARDAARHVGPAAIRAAGMSEDELIGPDAWAELEVQFMTWGATAQDQAVDLAHTLVGYSTVERNALKLRQADDLAEAWSWMRDALQGLAARRLYGEDAVAAALLGEFDPTSSVPAGLVRQALAIAGGEAGMPAATHGSSLYVFTGSDDGPLGGIGTGDLIHSSLLSNGVGTEGYEWEYGAAYRKSPFPEHEALDGMQFTNFDDGALSAADSWTPFGSFFPGDHDGCQCDFIPIYLGPAEG